VSNSTKLKVVTTSWDDGDSADLKLAELLRSKGILGTFYVPMRYREHPMSHAELRSLADEGFEIGAHGWNHKLLWRLQPDEALEEVKACKIALEDILGKRVDMFCYPKGRYDANAVRAVQEAGYAGARTVRMLATRPPSNPFRMPMTLQAYPHAPIIYFRNIGRSRSFESLRSCLVQLPRLGNWVELGKSLFDRVLNEGGVWHLSGHSWEIERLGIWDALCELLDYVCQRDEVRYVPNCGLLQLKSLNLSRVERESLHCDIE